MFIHIREKDLTFHPLNSWLSYLVTKRDSFYTLRRASCHYVERKVSFLKSAIISSDSNLHTVKLVELVLRGKLLLKGNDRLFTFLCNTDGIFTA